MFINGKSYENISCKKCRFRHPQEFSCAQSAEFARIDREAREELDREHAELQERIQDDELNRLRAFAVYVRDATRDGCANYSGISLTALASEALGE